MKSVLRFALCSLLCLALPAPAQVVISEFMADNKKTLADEDQQFSDWIELYNTSPTTVNLSGWSLTDDATHQARWFFPATNLTAKGFLVLFASGKNRALPGAPLHTDFSLKASGEYLALLKPDGSVATEFAPAFPSQLPDISYGFAQAGSTNTLLPQAAAAKILIPTTSSLGASWTQTGFNDAAWRTGASGVGFQTTVAGFAVTNYLASISLSDLASAQALIANPSQQLAQYAENVATINYLSTGAGGHYGNDRTFPGLTMGVDQNQFVVQASGTLTIPTPGYWTFGVHSDDGFGQTVGGFNMSYPGGRSPGDTVQTFYFAAPGDYPLELIYFEMTGGSEVEFFAAPGTFSAWDSSFRLVGDTAGGGLAIQAPVVANGGGAGNYRPYINTDLQAQMSGLNASAYLRFPFTVSAPAALQSLTLRLMYDDGFVAYLNGQKVAERNAPASPQWNSSATAPHPASGLLAFENLNLSDRLNLLQPGTNVLAIQGLNLAAADPDFLILPELLEYRLTNTTANFFAVPSPDGPNTSGFIAVVGDTKFSVSRGFYDTPFTLAITTATASATIRYTINGSTPSPANGTIYTGPLTISGTTVIRAAAFKSGYLPSNVDTESYIFVNDVVRQSPNGQAPAGWPTSWGANVVDYGMDPDVVNNPAYSGTLSNALKSLPTYCIVTDLGNLFDPATGIYANAAQDGIDWERPASVELIYPDGRKGFHINGGLRVRGGYSRSTGNPKHAFRFFFRQEYGASKLDYPAFANQGGADTFDSYDLRTFQNYSWSFGGDYRFTALRDQFSRDTQLALGQPAERGDYYHLYINGQYWGLYNTDERAEAAYGASYLGGLQEEYDVVKVDTSAGYTIMATDGNLDAWTRLWRAATNGFANDADYFKVQGLNVDGSPNAAYENLLEVDNLIDYMLVIFFTGNIDAPVSQFIGNSNPNNMYAMRNRTGQYGGFRFFLHDSEHTLLHESSLPSSGELWRDRTGPFPAGDPLQQGEAAALARSNPQYLFTRLMDNAEFRLRVADRVQKQFFNGGVLTTEACRARFQIRSNEIYQAVACESARWGDSKSSVPLTRDVEWATEMNRVYDDYFGQRPGIVLGQLQAKALYPTAADAPLFSQFGGNVNRGFVLTLSAPAGIIYYTRDGSDPRLRGGAIAPGALRYTGPLTLTQSAHLKARVLNGSTWSALSETTFYVIQHFTELLLTEIMYHPAGATNVDGDEYEFIELKNVAGTPLELSGVHFTNGLDYTFPVGSFVAPGAFVVLARNPAALTNRYPGLRVDGVYSGKLSNSGETLTLAHVTGEPIFSVAYGTRPPWPAAADGTGFSLVPVNPNYNPDPSQPSQWRASALIGGSPGADDPALSVPPVLITEVLTHTDPPQLDSVELYNPNPTNVAIGNWYLTDQRTQPQKFRLPPNTVIPAHGYVVFTEADWNADPLSSTSFRLDSHGESIYVYSADTNGNLTGYSDGFSFGAAQNGVSFGRYVISTGEAQYPAQRINSLGSANAGPRVGPVVINEIHYHPGPGSDAFLELKSLTNAPVPLFDPLFPTNTWRLNGLGFAFPTNVTLAPTSLALVVSIDPAAFRAKYSVPGAVPIFGPYSGSLQNGGESVALQFPDHPDLDTNSGTVFIPYVDVDVVRYNDQLPWPTNADGAGASLERITAAAYGNDPINWRASLGAPSPGFENDANRLPQVYAGPDQSLAVTQVPVAITLAGTASDDGRPQTPGALSIGWRQVSGPAPAWFSQPNQPQTTAFFPGAGTYVLRLTANDGELQGSDEVTINIQRPLAPLPTTLIAKGSIWKFLDNGSDQGTAWTARTFNDTNWLSGPAPLGYGDANGQWPATTNAYGPYSNNRYVTTYYRHSFSAPALYTNLVVSVQRDDGVVVYLNGTGIFTNNMPINGPIGYLTNAAGVVGGADETTFYSQAVPASLLLPGLNVVAAEIHQANASSSDIIFDLQLAGESLPVNQAPSVYAGPDQNLTLPASAALNGSATDDALPLSPGRLSLTWSKVSGPGAVTFANPNALQTVAAFSTNGLYVLRLTASDGAFSVSDDLTVTAAGQALPLRIDSADWSGGGTPALRLRFRAVAGLTYTVQYRDSLTTGTWLKLADVPAQPALQTVEVTDPTAGNTPTRYYRIVTP